MAPGNFDARMGLAQVQLVQDDCAAAADAFRDLAAEQPRLGGPLVGQARAADCLKDARRAIELFRQAIDLEPCNAEALGRLGTVYAREGRWDEAQQMFSRSWRCSASGADVQTEIGYASLADGDPDTAVDALVLAQQLDRFRPGAALGLCLAYLASGDSGHALSACEQASDGPMPEPQAQHAHALALIGAGRDVEAVRLLEPLVALQPDHAGLHHSLGVAYLNLKDYQSAARVRGFRQGCKLS